MNGYWEHWLQTKACDEVRNSLTRTMRCRWVAKQLSDVYLCEKVNALSLLINSYVFIKPNLEWLCFSDLWSPSGICSWVLLSLRSKRSDNCVSWLKEERTEDRERIPEALQTPGWRKRWFSHLSTFPEVRTRGWVAMEASETWPKCLRVTWKKCFNLIFCR